VTTAYLVCPYCHIVTAIAPERTISEAAYTVWCELRVLHKPGERIVLAHQINRVSVSSPKTLHKYMQELVRVGLMERVPFTPKRQPDGAGESRADPGACGEEAPPMRRPTPAAKATRHWYRLPGAPKN